MNSLFYFFHQYWSTLVVFSLLIATGSFAVIWLQDRFFKSNNQAQELKNNPENKRQDFSDLYDRIHNYKSPRSSVASTSTPQTSSQASLNTHYHHAIKLLQRGMDTKTLIEYCNLTYGEAELLQVVYGRNFKETKTGVPA